MKPARALGEEGPLGHTYMMISSTMMLLGFSRVKLPRSVELGSRYKTG